MIKYTPGPWTYQQDSCAQCELEKTAEYYIPEIPGGYHAQFSNENDARLISAAPDLLEALQNLADVADNTPVPLGRNLNTIAELTQAIDIARAAIAKALGKDWRKDAGA